MCAEGADAKVQAQILGHYTAQLVKPGLSQRETAVAVEAVGALAASTNRFFGEPVRSILILLHHQRHAGSAAELTHSHCLHKACILESINAGWTLMGVHAQHASMHVCHRQISMSISTHPASWLLCRACASFWSTWRPWGRRELSLAATARPAARLLLLRCSSASAAASDPKNQKHEYRLLGAT